MQTRRGFLSLFPAAVVALSLRGEDGRRMRLTSAGGPAGVEISPQLELLSGVLAQTEWIKLRGPRGEPSRYFKELQAWFSGFHSHHSVKLAGEFTRRGFTYDAPPAFALHLGALPELPLAYPYSEYLIKRADGQARLEEFRQALCDLARESDFPRFFLNHRKDYDRWCESTCFERGKAVAWLERFYGSAGGEFRLVLAPAMYPSGGYGATVTSADGRKTVYQVVRVAKDEKGVPVFPKGDGLMALSLHEWGHSYVNPALEAHAERIQRLGSLYEPVRAVMKKQAYGTIAVFFNEQVLRACTLFAWEEGGVLPVAAAKQQLAAEENRGFYLTAKIVSWLRDEYLRNRNAYADFSSFVPTLLDRLEALAKAKTVSAGKT